MQNLREEKYLHLSPIKRSENIFGRNESGTAKIEASYFKISLGGLFYDLFSQS